MSNTILLEAESQLFVVLSDDLLEKLNQTTLTNANNPRIDEWGADVDYSIYHLSISKIALDYANKIKRKYRAQTFRLNVFEFDFYYTIKIARKTQRPYLYIIDIDLNEAMYGLTPVQQLPQQTSAPQPTVQQQPTNNDANGQVQEHLQRRINRIITEVINSYLNRECRLVG